MIIRLEQAAASFILCNGCVQVGSSPSGDVYSGKSGLPFKLAALYTHCKKSLVGSLAVLKAALELKNSPSLDVAVAVAALLSAIQTPFNLLVQGSYDD